jgi:hypothetical protein
VIVCASGGGKKAALWAIKVLQTANSATQDKLMAHTMLMSCVSGGALGVSYFRELYLRSKLGEDVDPYAEKHLDQIAQNTLNPVVFTLVTNDILLDLGQFEYQGMTYRRDRGHALEAQINRQTDGLLEKPLSAYRAPELKSIIPMLLLAPTIINDGRKLFISPQNVSYMGADFTEGNFTKENSKVKGIDFMHFFRAQGAENLRFLSALRMVATYPYVLPSVALPSNPAMEVMDAALFDNFGVTDAIQFLYIFREWIAENTSGIILVTIRNSTKEEDIARCKSKSLFQAFTNPIDNFQFSWANMQDIRNDSLIEQARLWIGHSISEIEFQYAPPKQGPYAQLNQDSLSWHLTAEEKANIIQAIHAEDNQKSLARLVTLLK